MKQSELPMNDYIAKFRDVAEHVYSIKATNNASAILASNVIEGVQNPHIKNKLKFYQVKNLKDIFGHAIQEDQKWKVRVLNLGVAPYSETTATTNCSINTIRDKGCFKYGSKAHFVKECPFSQPGNVAHKGPYMDCRNAYSYDGATEKVVEPLTRLFTGLVKQLKLVTPSGQGGNPNYDGKVMNGRWMGSNNGHRQQTNDHYHKREEPNKDYHHRSSFRLNGHQWGNKDGHTSNFSRRPHTRINKVKSDNECDSEFSTMSNIEDHLEEEVEPVQTSPKN